LTKLKDWKAMEKSANERLARDPNDVGAIEQLANVQEIRGNMEKARQILRSGLEKGKPSAELWNNYAWSGLFLDRLPDDTVDAAQRANRLTENKSFPSMHTLASVYAEVGRVGESHELVIKLLDVGQLDEPNEAVWYVVGRIAEQYGRNDAALSAYQRLEKDEDPFPTSTYLLAQRAIQRINRATAKK